MPPKTPNDTCHAYTIISKSEGLHTSVTDLVSVPELVLIGNSVFFPPHWQILPPWYKKILKIEFYSLKNKWGYLKRVSIFNSKRKANLLGTWNCLGENSHIKKTAVIVQQNPERYQNNVLWACREVIFSPEHGRKGGSKTTNQLDVDLFLINTS